MNDDLDLLDYQDLPDYSDEPPELENQHWHYSFYSCDENYNEFKVNDDSDYDKDYCHIKLELDSQYYTINFNWYKENELPCLDIYLMDDDFSNNKILSLKEATIT